MITKTPGELISQRGKETVNAERNWNREILASPSDSRSIQSREGPRKGTSVINLRQAKSNRAYKAYRREKKKKKWAEQSRDTSEVAARERAT
jgi:hypothetical protein